MKHSEFRARLSEYLERDLIPEERARIETHLETCADCALELRELRATVSLLRRLPEPGHPPGLGDAVMARIAQGASRPISLRVLLRRAAEPRFAAALAATLAGFIVLVQAVGREIPLVTGGQQIAFGAGRLPPAFESGLWGPDEPRPRAVGAGVVSNSASYTAGVEYARRAHMEEVARLLRGAGHPYSASLASHFDSQPTVVMADWQPR